MSFNGALLVILAAVFWGLSGGLGGFLMDQGWDPLVVSFYRGAIGLICVSVWHVIKPTRWNKKMIVWSLVAGLGVAGNFIFYFLSISEASIAVAATLMYTAPIFVMLVSFLLKIEKPSLFKWVAIGLVMTGVALLTEVYAAGSDGITFFGLATGLGAGLSYALFIFAFKNASRHGEPQGILVVAFSIFTLLIIFFIDYNEALSVISSPDLIWMILLGVFGAGLSFYLYIKGLNRTAPTSASIIAMVEPVTASLFGAIVLSEVLTGIQLGGMAIILVTVTLLSLNRG